MLYYGTVMMRREETSTEKRSLIAKLMATENIDVRFEHVSTAAFDLENRQLVLPIYEGFSDEVYSMMIAHEVSHALNTPNDDWSKAIGNDATKAAYLNIVEDARIERLIKKRYPGVVNDFKTGYAELHERDFFGVADKDLSSLSLIDRLNLYFKSYGHLNVPFSKDEVVWVNKVSSTVTFEDAVRVTEELYDSITNPTEKPDSGDGKSEDENDETEGEDAEGTSSDDSGDENADSDVENGEGESSDSGDENGEDSDETDESDNGSGKGEGDLSGEDSEEKNDRSEGDESAPTVGDDSEDGEGTGENDSTSAEDVNDNDSAKNEKTSAGADDETREAPEPVTQGNLDKNLENSANDDYYRGVGTIVVEDPDVDERWSDLVEPYESFLAIEREEIRKTGNRYRRCYGDDQYDTITEDKVVGMYKALAKENSKVINHMIKEFELKKSAAEHKRSMTSKTGNIDMDRLYQYQTNDDIFLRNEVVPEGKNHGVVMYVDFSGSMAAGRNYERIRNTMMQIFNMAMFCSKTGIPYRVYAFTNAGRDNTWNASARADIADRGARFYSRNHGMVEGRMYNPGDSSFRLLTILDSRMRKADWLFAMGLIAGSSVVTTNVRRTDWDFVIAYLGGTPLNIALYIAPYVIRDFQNENRVDKTIFMLYTDGGAGDYFSVVKNERITAAHYGDAFFDPKTKRMVRSAKAYNFTTAFQSFLTERIGMMTGAKVMGYDIREKRASRSVATDTLTITGRSIWDEIETRSAIERDYKENGFVHVTGAYGFDSFTFVCENSGAENADIESELRGKGSAEDASVRALEGAFIRANRKTNDSRYLVKKLMEVIG